MALGIFREKALIKLLCEKQHGTVEHYEKHHGNVRGLSLQNVSIQEVIDIINLLNSDEDEE